MSLRVKVGNSQYLYMDDLDTGSTKKYHLIIYGDDKFVCKNVSNLYRIEEIRRCSIKDRRTIRILVTSFCLTWHRVRVRGQTQS